MTRYLLPAKEINAVFWEGSGIATLAGRERRAENIAEIEKWKEESGCDYEIEWLGEYFNLHSPDRSMRFTVGPRQWVIWDKGPRVMSESAFKDAGYREIKHWQGFNVAGAPD